MRCDWSLAKTQFEKVLQYFRWDAIGIWPRHNLERSLNIFSEMRLDFGSDRIWNCLWIFSVRCDWNLAKTQFGIVLKYFRWNAIGLWLKQNLKLSLNIFGGMRLEIGSEKIWNCLTIFSVRCDWNLAKTQLEIVLDYFRSDAIGIWLRHNLKLS